MNLKDVYGIRVERTARIRVGRGWGSGVGKTSGRGEKGAGRRSGTRFRLRFEGGQMPLYRRLPKKGFRNHAFRMRFLDVNVGDLERAFDAGATVDLDALRAAHLAPKSADLWKVLGDGTLSKALTVKAHAASEQAKAKIAAAGGTLVLEAGPHRERAEALAARRAGLAKRREEAVASAKAEAEKAAAAFRAARKDAKKTGGKKVSKKDAAKGRPPEAGAPKGEKGGGEASKASEKAPPKGEKGGSKPEGGGKPPKG